MQRNHVLVISAGLIFMIIKKMNKDEIKRVNKFENTLDNLTVNLFNPCRENSFTVSFLILKFIIHSDQLFI